MSTNIFRKYIDIIEGLQNNGNGVGPFKIYVENHFIDQFPTLEEAESEVDFLRKSEK